MSETAEVPWDLQIQGRAPGLWRRIKSQRNTLAGKDFTKPVVKGTTRQAIGHHMAALGVQQDGGYSKYEWRELTKGKLAAARTARLSHMVAEARKEGPLCSDEAYMQGVTLNLPMQARLGSGPGWCLPLEQGLSIVASGWA